MKTLPVKGCVDYLPKEMEIRQQVIETILKVYKSNGFLQVKTPILENLENLTSGDSGDNTKMMFKTIKRGEKLNLRKDNLKEEDLVEEGLRYDLTVPLARLFTKNRNDLPFPFKSIQIDESFRAEKPQEGRNRQFTQCDIDIWGEKTILGEIEIITTIMETYKKLGLSSVVCKISNRQILNQVLNYCGIGDFDIFQACTIIDKLDKIGVEGCAEEFNKAGFSQDFIRSIVNALTQIRQNGIDSLSGFGVEEGLIQDMRDLLKIVRSVLIEGFSIEFDISIVRGQGYYTGCVFEFYSNETDYKGALGGGGRYDKMYEKFAGVSVPAVGYGLGLDRVLLVLNKLNKEDLYRSKKLALIYKKDDKIEQIMQLKEKYKEEYDVSIFAVQKNFKEFLRKIKLNGYGYIVWSDKQIIESI